MPRTGARLGAAAVARGPHAALQLVIHNERCARARVSSVAMHEKVRAVYLHGATSFTISPGVTSMLLKISARKPAQTASSDPTADHLLQHGQRRNCSSNNLNPN